MISSMHPSFWGWFCCNYLQLRIRPNERPFKLHLYKFGENGYNTPFLEDLYLPKTLILRYVAPIPFLLDQLSDSRYVMTFVDEYYIPHRAAYRKFHHNHDILIYGFDRERKVFYVAGYNENRRFAFTEVGFSEFERALHIGVSEGALGKWTNGLHLWKLRLDGEFTPNLKTIAELMEDYLFSRNTSLRYRLYPDSSEDIFGIGTYSCILDYLSKITGKEDMDVRVFHTFYEHKKSMVIRLGRLKDVFGAAIEAETIEAFRSIEKQALIVRNLGLKYEFNGDKKAIDRMAGIVRQIRSEEERIWSLAVEQIKRLL